MTDKNKKAVEVLNSLDSRFYIDMTDPLSRGRAEAVDVYDDGVLITINSSIWCWSAQTEKRMTLLTERVKKLSNGDCGMFIHETEYVSKVCDILHAEAGTPCYLGARFSLEPYDIKTDIEFRKLGHEYDDFVRRIYHFTKDDPDGLFYAKELIENGMYGGFKNGECVGFIGIHQEETMGVLEILPEFRRHGYGIALEQYLANEFVKQGRYPYCHILETNEVSLALQKKLGLWLSEGKRLVWLGYKE